jgi:diguanylate cyclase (GGDEF)-like protein
MKKVNTTLNIIAFQVGKTAIVATIYFLASFIGRFFTLADSDIPIIWPQVGFVLVALLLLGYTTLPGIFVGSLITSLVTGVPVMFSIIYSLGNILLVFVPAYFIFQQKDFSNALDDYRSVLSLVFFGAIIGPLISASISIVGMYFLQLNPLNSLPSIWGEQWMRNALGILIFSPVLLVWFGNPFPKFKTGQVIEGLIIFLGTIGLELLLYIGGINSEVVYPISFLVIPLIIWASIRINAHGSSLINFTTALIFLLGITKYEDVLLRDGSLSYLTIVCFICTMLITSLIISASMAMLRTTQKSLSYVSTHDSLTGLYNRLFFEAEFSRMEKSRLYPISIIMADVDELKNVNDTFGHSTGDQLLINVASLFSKVFRQEDIISRYGGDEFVVLLPGADASIAKEVINRIKKQIITFNKKHIELPISISMGVSTANQGESLKNHLKLADKHMYQEKNKKSRK